MLPFPNAYAGYRTVVDEIRGIDKVIRHVIDMDRDLALADLGLEE